jgi:hypothetical protein
MFTECTHERLTAISSHIPWGEEEKEKEREKG